MMVNKRCPDCGKEMSIYFNASRCYNCAIRHKKEYGRRRRNILRAIKKEHYF
jgi:hypothetical protein